MSHQAVNWAIEQRVGGPSAKATLWSIANYANESWCSWPSQKTISDESEQSADTVQRRIRDLEEMGLVRCIPLHFAGRRSVNFLILKPSSFFGSSLDEIEPLFPRGYSAAPHYAAATCGNAEPAESDVPSPDAAANAAANAAATVRQQENLGTKEDGDGGVARAREAPMISEEAHALASELAVIAGHDPQMLPTGWVSVGPAWQVQRMLNQGWQRQMMLDTARAVIAGKRDGPPHSIKYFEKPFAKAHAQQTCPTPLPKADVSAPESSHARPAAPSDWRSRNDQRHAAFANFKRSNAEARERAREDGSGGAVQLVSHARRDGP